MNEGLSQLRKRWAWSARRQRLSLITSVGMMGFVTGLLIVFLNLSAELGIRSSVAQGGEWELRMEEQAARDDPNLEILYVEKPDQLSDGSQLILRSSFDYETGWMLVVGRWPEKAKEAVATSAWARSHGLSLPDMADEYEITGIVESPLAGEKDLEVVYGLDPSVTQGLAYCALRAGAGPAGYEQLAGQYKCYLNPQLWNARYHKSPVEKIGWLFFGFAAVCAVVLTVILNRLFLTQREPVSCQLANLGIDAKMHRTMVMRMMLPGELTAWSAAIALLMAVSAFVFSYKRMACIKQLLLLWVCGCVLLSGIVWTLVHRKRRRPLHRFRHLHRALPLSVKEAVRTGSGRGIFLLVLINCLLFGCTCFYAERWMQSREALFNRQDDVTFHVTIAGGWEAAAQEKSFVAKEADKRDMSGTVRIELPCVINGIQATITEGHPSVLSGPFQDTKAETVLLSLWNEPAGTVEMEAQSVTPDDTITFTLSQNQIHNLTVQFPQAQIRLSGAYSGAGAASFADSLTRHPWSSETPVYVFDHQKENEREDRMRMLVRCLVYGLDGSILLATLVILRAVLLQNVYDSVRNLKMLRKWGLPIRSIILQRCRLVAFLCLLAGTTAGLVLAVFSPVLILVCAGYGIVAGLLLAAVQRHVAGANADLWSDPAAK